MSRPVTLAGGTGHVTAVTPRAAPWGWTVPQSTMKFRWHNPTGPFFPTRRGSVRRGKGCRTPRCHAAGSRGGPTSPAPAPCGTQAAPAVPERPTGGQRARCVTNPPGLGAGGDPDARGQPRPPPLRVSKIATGKVPPTRCLLRTAAAASLRAAPGMLLLHPEMAACHGGRIQPLPSKSHRAAAGVHGEALAADGAWRGPPNLPRVPGCLLAAEAATETAKPPARFLPSLPHEYLNSSGMGASIFQGKVNY